MLHKLTLDRFKALDREYSIPIAPITILCGPNSAGKSSVLQSLLLLKQTLEAADCKSALQLDGRYLKVNTLRELSHNCERESSAVIKYGFWLGEGEDRSLEIEFRSKICGTDRNRKPCVNSFSWNHKGSRGNTKLVNETHTWNYDLEQLGVGIPPGIQMIGKPIVRFDKFYPVGLSAKFADEEGNSNKTQLYLPIGYIKNMDELLGELKNELNNLKYLSPLRAKPQKGYIFYGDDEVDLATDGANIGHVLYTHRSKKVLFDDRRIGLLQAVNASMKLLGLDRGVAVSKQGDMFYSVEMVEHEENRHTGKKGISQTIADVGFGYSQTLPVIVRGLTAPDRSIVLYEQPEIHLHPACKSNLADFFIKASSTDKRFIIETHSPELIERLRLRIVENPELSSKVKVLFFERDDSGRGLDVIREIEMGEDGLAREWPKGFLDEQDAIVREMLKARITKRRSAK